MSDKNTFEQNLKRLEEIVRLLESSEAELDRSLSLFEEGTALVRACTKELDEAQAKITVLTKGDSDE